MKKIFLIMGVLCLILNVKGQNSCNTAFPFYSSTGLTLPMSTSTTAPVGPNYGCLATQPNPTYVYLPVCGAGDFVIDISNSANSDIDFIAWGPFYTNDINVVCNSITSNSGIDCSFSTSPTETINIPNANVGEVYLIMIVNYAGVPTNLSMTQTSGLAIADSTCSQFNLSCGIYNLPICEVTMNDSANHCKILWEKIPNLAIDKYYIHRLNAQNNYVIIDSIPESDSSFYVDYSSIPSTQPYRYKINYKDSCGNINMISNAHQTMHLQASPGFNAVNLDWDSYLGLTFPTYYILRGTDPFNMNIIDSISSAFTSYTDFNSVSSEPCYQIGFTNPDPCLITRSFEMKVVSNVFNTNPLNIDNNFTQNVKLFPNPADKIITINIPELSSKVNFQLFDAVGRFVQENNLTETSNLISVETLPQGIYFYQIYLDGVVSAKGKLIID